MPQSQPSADSKVEQSPLFLLIDGHSLAFRSYYAFAMSRQGPLRTATGIPTSVCFGFLNSLFQVLQSENPHSLAVAFDLKEATFRHEADVNYKAGRKETPEDFIPDLANLQELLTALNLQIVTAVGFEADDVLGTLAYQASEAGYRVKIVSGDRDLFQLVDAQKSISVLYLERTAFKSSVGANYTEFDPEAVKAKLGVEASQVVDYKALCGDKSDNIPGVRGIGEKTAVKLLETYGSLKNVYENLTKIKRAIQTKLATDRENAEHSRFLAQIVTDVPLRIDLQEFELAGFNSQLVQPLLDKLQLKSFLDKIQQLQQQLGGSLDDSSENQTEASNQQLSLFDSAKASKSPTPPSLETASFQPAQAITPRIIDTPEQLSELIQLLEKQNSPEQPVAWDTETTGLDPRNCQLVGIGCCWGFQPDNCAYIPLGHTTGNQLETSVVLSALRPILSHSHYPKSLQNAKFDREVFFYKDIDLQGVVFDTMLASYVLHPEQSHNLTDLCQRYLTGIRSLSYKELNLSKKQTIADLEINTAANYCGLDVYGTYHLVPKLRAELDAIPDLKTLLLHVEQPLEQVLATMEYQGIRIDSDYLKHLSEQLAEELQQLELSVYETAGTEFNLDSPKQLATVLFEKLNLNRKKSRKTKTGYSTDRATLDKLQGDHPIIDAILSYRTLAKLKSTYVDALPQLVEPKTQRIHTDFNQTITATGRLSSSNPNLQNIPIRSEFSRKIRKAFLPEPGWSLVSADYSQIELRILAHLSQEPVLINAYRTGQDVHAVTTKLLLDKEDITSEERNLGKTINFGVIYGMGAQRFAREAGVSSETGKSFIQRYREKYAKVFAYLEECKKAAIANGFVSTILGRRRYFEFTSDSLRQLKGTTIQQIDLGTLKPSYVESQLLRGAANAPIQGSSADIIKLAMLKVDQLLEPYQAKMLLQVHDELVLEVPDEEIESLPNKIKETMENAIELSIPLVVDVHVGKNWMEAK